VLADAQQADRRNAIVRLLRNSLVHKQGDLVHLLQRDGYAVTQSSVSRDLRDLGALAQFVRQILPAGNCLTVVKTTIGAAASVAVAIDKAEWPEVVGTISGDDTIFIATHGEPAQGQLIARLRTNFRV
jgi:transcriptional regulator of arginine metabolism